MCFFFNDTATTEIYTLSLHDALPIWLVAGGAQGRGGGARHHLQVVRGLPGEVDQVLVDDPPHAVPGAVRSEEHTSELQSRQYLVCRLLLEKKTTRSSTISIFTHARAS